MEISSTVFVVPLNDVCSKAEVKIIMKFALNLDS